MYTKECSVTQSYSYEQMLVTCQFNIAHYHLAPTMNLKKVLGVTEPLCRDTSWKPSGLSRWTQVPSTAISTKSSFSTINSCCCEHRTLTTVDRQVNLISHKFLWSILLNTLMRTIELKQRHCCGQFFVESVGGGLCSGGELVPLLSQDGF